MINIRGLKLQKLNRTLAFYIHQYGIQCNNPLKNDLQENQGVRTPTSVSQLASDVANIQEDDSTGGYFELDVHHPDSPYGLIQDVLKPVFRKKPQIGFLDNNNQLDLGGLDSNEVWLSQGNLLVLKGDVKTFSSKEQCTVAVRELFNLVKLVEL